MTEEPRRIVTDDTKLLENSADPNSATLSSIQEMLLTKLERFTISNTKVHYFDKFHHKKSIFIKTLNWGNKGGVHQGIGLLKLDNQTASKGLSFIVNLQQNSDEKVSGELYLHADNLNISSYIKNQINPHAKVSAATLDGEVWVSFTENTISNIQVKMKNMELAWHLINSSHHWKLNSGELQLSNSRKGWLLDSYNLNIENNGKRIKDLSIAGRGDESHADINLSGFSIAKIVPVYQFFSNLSINKLKMIRQLDFGGKLTKIKLSKNLEGEFEAGLSLRSFKNRPVRAIPGLSNANIDVFGGLKSGSATIKLPKQKIYFDGQFNRPFPITSGNIPLHWLQTKTGIKLYSDQTLLVTNELDTMTHFSAFFGNKKIKNTSPFLSLYSYASLNDAGQADHYFPINAMGFDVYNYLLPTLKKGTVKGAQILWYGAISDYPYAGNNGVFQAYVPVRNAKFDFYEGWEGLTDLDLDLLFENDGLTMVAKKATLGSLKVDKLYGEIDRLHPEGILTINAELNEDAQKATDYLSRSPYKDSVGSALKIIDAHDDLQANLKIVIPFNRKKHKPEVLGDIKLHNNTINLKLSEKVSIPLKNVNGSFNFVNGDLQTKNITASYLNQPLSFHVTSKEERKAYEINVKLSAKWDINKLKIEIPQLKMSRLSGEFDWVGNVDFSYDYGKGYHFDVDLKSALQGVDSLLPSPFDKNRYQKWPLNINLKGDNKGVTAQVDLAKKLSLNGYLNEANNVMALKYLDVQIGSAIAYKQINTKQQKMSINLPYLDISPWYDLWQEVSTNKNSAIKSKNKSKAESLFKLNEINVDIKKVLFFNQPIDHVKSTVKFSENNVFVNVESDKLITELSYRDGMPARFDVTIDKLDFNNVKFPTAENSAETSNNGNKKTSKKIQFKSKDMRKDYPEIFLKCEVCLWNDMDFSPMSMHVYPTQSNLKIESFTIGEGDELTSLSGIWDQKRTNVIVDSNAKNNHSIIQRLKYVNPITFKAANANAAVNWIGAPWEFNTETLSGIASGEIENGSVTEINDRGARLLSVFSLDGIRRTLNLEYGNLFDKGFNFDVITLTTRIQNGILKTDDFYLDGSAGKILGKGQVDLAHQKTNLRISYSPAISGSLPVLAAFAINPITGAAALVISKLIQPVVESIVRVDFSVKGDLNDPKIEIVGKEKGMVKLDNSDALNEIEESIDQK